MTCEELGKTSVDRFYTMGTYWDMSIAKVAVDAFGADRVGVSVLSQNVASMPTATFQQLAKQGVRHLAVWWDSKPGSLSQHAWEKLGAWRAM